MKKRPKISQPSCFKRSLRYYGATATDLSIQHVKTRPCGHRIISSAPQPPTYWYLTKIAASGGGCSIIAENPEKLESAKTAVVLSCDRFDFSGSPVNGVYKVLY